MRKRKLGSHRGHGIVATKSRPLYAIIQVDGGYQDEDLGKYLHWGRIQGMTTSRRIAFAQKRDLYAAKGGIYQVSLVVLQLMPGYRFRDGDEVYWEIGGMPFKRNPLPTEVDDDTPGYLGGLLIASLIGFFGYVVYEASKPPAPAAASPTAQPVG